MRLHRIIPWWGRRRGWRGLHPLERAAWIAWAAVVVWAFLAVPAQLVLKHIAPLLTPDPARVSPAQLSGTVERIYWSGISYFSILMVLSVLMPLLMITGHFKHQAQLRKSMFLICPGCRYDLSGTRRVSRCPECGREFPVGGVRREWRRLMPNRSRRPFWPDWIRRTS